MENNCTNCLKEFQNIYYIYSDRIKRVKNITKDIREILKNEISETEASLKRKKRELDKKKWEDYESFFMPVDYFEASKYLANERLEYEIHLIALYKKALNGENIKQDMIPQQDLDLLVENIKNIISE